MLSCEGAGLREESTNPDLEFAKVAQCPERKEHFHTQNSNHRRRESRTNCPGQNVVNPCVRTDSGWLYLVERVFQTDKEEEADRKGSVKAHKYSPRTPGSLHRCNEGGRDVP